MNNYVYGMLREALADMHGQVTRFAETYGEADFDTSKATAALALTSGLAHPTPQTAPAAPAEPVAWRRATKYGWEYRQSAPTAKTRGNGWMPLYAHPTPQAEQAEAVKASVFLRNLHYFFAQTDGSYLWPQGATGDLLKQAKAEIETLLTLINTPEIEDFMKGVPLEAAHQVERWGAENDAGKTPLDWFWLVGYLAQKAATAAIAGDTEKARHHCISTAAVMLNWHLHNAGERTAMRPGIEEPQR